MQKTLFLKLTGKVMEKPINKDPLPLELHKRLQKLEVNQEIMLSKLIECFDGINQLLSHFEKSMPGNNIQNASSNNFEMIEEIPYNEVEPNETIDESLFEINFNNTEHPEIHSTYTNITENISGHNSIMTSSSFANLNDDDSDHLDDSIKSIDADPMIICQDCGKAFVKGSFTDSMTKHLRETACKPYKCHLCDKHFKLVKLNH